MYLPHSLRNTVGRSDTETRRIPGPQPYSQKKWRAPAGVEETDATAAKAIHVNC